MSTALKLQQPERTGLPEIVIARYLNRISVMAEENGVTRPLSMEEANEVERICNSREYLRELFGDLIERMNLRFGQDEHLELESLVREIEREVENRL